MFGGGGGVVEVEYSGAEPPPRRKPVLSQESRGPFSLMKAHSIWGMNA